MPRPASSLLFCLVVLVFYALPAHPQPVRVFILAGQSNMEGKASASTLRAVIDAPETHDRFAHLMTEDGWAVRDDVFVTFLDRQETPVSPLHGPLTVGFGSPKNARDEEDRRIRLPGVGPELGIGWVLGDHYDEPVLLIKAAWGGRAVRHTFRPPSAMPTAEELAEHLERVREKNPDMTLEELRSSYGSDYRKILSEVGRVLDNIALYVPGYDETEGYEITGFIWFQGWNDGVGGGNPGYTEQMTHFIQDIRRDLDRPELPFVIGELGIDGEDAGGWIAAFRDQQAAIADQPAFRGNVALAPTARYWPNPPDLSREWAEFRAAASENEKRAEGDPERIDPGEFFREHWALKYEDELAFTSDRRYHYLGSGRCYYEMGESMAQAMLELIND